MQHAKGDEQLERKGALDLEERVAVRLGRVVEHRVVLCVSGGTCQRSIRAKVSARLAQGLASVHRRRSEWLGAGRWDAVTLRVDPGWWPVLVCQRKRAVRRGSGAGPAQGAPERCASVSEVSWSDVTKMRRLRKLHQTELGLGYTCLREAI